MHRQRIRSRAAFTLSLWLGCAISSHAASVAYQFLSDPSLITHWPGPDGLIGSADDVVDGGAMTVGGSGPNTSGSLSQVSFDFGPLGAETKLAPSFDAVSFFGIGSFDFDATAGNGSPLVTGFEIVDGTEPFVGHGPYSATTSGTIIGTSGPGTFSVTAAPYDTIIEGNPDSAVMSFSGTYTLVDPNGPATGDPYLDNVVTPIALANNAQSYVVLTGTGASGAADNFSFGNMPVQVTLVGYQVPEPSTLTLGALAALALLRRRR